MKILRGVLVMMVLSCAIPSLSAEWVPIENAESYFDKSNIHTDRAGNTWFWLKDVLPDYLIKMSADNLKSNGHPIDYSEYSHSLRYEGVNCKQGTIAISQVLDYDKNGHIIESTKTDKIEFEPVTPESLESLIFKTVCNYISKKKKSKTPLR